MSRDERGTLAWQVLEPRYHARLASLGEEFEKARIWETPPREGGSNREAKEIAEVRILKTSFVVTPVLEWVKPEAEPEIRAAFARARAAATKKQADASVAAGRETMEVTPDTPVAEIEIAAAAARKVPEDRVFTDAPLGALLEHDHLENNVPFPRVVSLNARAGARRAPGVGAH